MKRIRTFVALAAACLILGGCANMGYGLDAAVQVGDEGESAYALLKYPSAWSFAGITSADAESGADPATKPEQGTLYSQVMISPSDTSSTAPETQVLAGANKNAMPVHPDSSDETIYDYFDSLISTSFGDANVTNKNITREGEATIVTYDYSYSYSGGELTSEFKYIFDGDYVYFVQGSSTGNAEEMDVTTMKAMVNEFGLSALV